MVSSRRKDRIYRDHFPELIFAIETANNMLLSEQASFMQPGTASDDWRPVSALDIENWKEAAKTVTTQILRVKILQALCLDRPGPMTLHQIRERIEGDLQPKWLAHSLTESLHFRVVPAFDSMIAQEQAFQAGNQAVLITCLRNLEVVSESDLTWEQVREFRSDLKNRERYRRLVHWFDKEMAGKTLPFIQDELALRLSDYERALKKHGVVTITGTLSAILDWKSVASGSAAAGAVSLLSGDSSLAAVAGLAISVGKTAVSVVESRLRLDDLRCGPGSEVAFAYEVRKLQKQQSNSKS